jgi:hypothetical protein
MCDRRACDGEQTRAQDARDAARLLRVPAMGKSCRMAAHLEEDNGSAKVSWDRAAMDASSVVGDIRDALA